MQSVLILSGPFLGKGGSAEGARNARFRMRACNITAATLTHQ